MCAHTNITSVKYIKFLHGEETLHNENFLVISERK